MRLLYFHGQFDAQALRLTSVVLAVSAPSLLLYSLQKIYLGLFYAHQDTTSLVWSSAAQLLTSVVGCLLLAGRYGAPGIAFSSTVSSFVGLAAMYVLAKKHGY